MSLSKLAAAEIRKIIWCFSARSFYKKYTLFSLKFFVCLFVQSKAFYSYFPQAEGSWSKINYAGCGDMMERKKFQPLSA